MLIYSYPGFHAHFPTGIEKFIYYLIYGVSMTQIRHLDVECPNCGKKQEITFYQSLFLDDPYKRYNKGETQNVEDLKNYNRNEISKILSGEINRFKCRGCNFKTFLPFSFSFIDQEKRYKVVFTPFDKIDDMINSDMITSDGWLNMEKIIHDLPIYKIMKKTNQLDGSAEEYMKRTHFVFSMEELILYIAFREKLALYYANLPKSNQ